MVYIICHPRICFPADFIDGAEQNKIEVNFNFKKADLTKFMNEKLSPVHDKRHLKRLINEIIV